MLEKIEIRGAREHNLKNIDVEIPHGKLTVISGVSGSGKSSLAFDTLYAEGQRRYVESLTTYAKQFLERIARPDVDDVSGISPSIAIQQKNTTRNARSTVGTTTEIYDYLRLLFARVGRTFCPQCDKEVAHYEPDEVVGDMTARHAGRPYLVIATVTLGDDPRSALERLVKEGYSRALVGGAVCRIADTPRKKLASGGELQLVLDRVTIDEDQRARIFEAVETAYVLGGGFVRFRDVETGKETVFTRQPACVSCGRTFEQPRPLLFSFNTPYGACPECRGFGNRMEFDERLIVPDGDLSLREGAIEPWASPKFEYFHGEMMRFCRRKRISTTTAFSKLPSDARRMILEGDDGFVGVIPFLEDLREKLYKKYARFFTRRYLTFRECRRCRGGRLRPEAYNVRLGGVSIREVSRMCPGEALAFVESLVLTDTERVVARDILVELRSRLQFLLDVGLYYLTLDRLTKTLSGGEAQRINLANSLGANLIGVLYVLDEPSVGLHPRDTDRLVEVLTELRNRGNTVVVVEHDLDIIRRADYLIDLGPGAGRGGGEVLYQGDLKRASHPRSKTIQYLSSGLPLAPGRRSRGVPGEAGHTIALENVRRHNLKGIDVSFPAGAFTVVTGVSGSGKSTLVCDVLYNALRSPGSGGTGACARITGGEHAGRVLLVDQSPIGKTPRSNPITYIKAFSLIRDIFAAQRVARKRGYASGRFSFNVAGGRCARCEGMGHERIEMHFMADMFVRCPECEGRRFNSDTLDVRYRGKNLADVLDLTVDEAIGFFGDHRALVGRLDVLRRVGLGYVQLGQPSTTLSGGESQRMKIARELAEKTTDKAVYLLDEPTTGLHIEDVDVLIRALRELVERRHTIVVVEHNPQVILQADHVIDLGPGGGEDGGEIVAEGTPKDVMKVRASHTGAYLKKMLNKKRKVNV